MKIKRKTLEGIKRWLLLSGIFLGVFCVWYVYYRTSIFTIEKYIFTGITEEYSTQIEEGLRSSSSTYAYGIIPTNKVLSYSNAAIIQAITEVLPEVSSVSIRPSGLHTLKIVVTEYVPLFRTDNEKMITKEGVIFRTTQDTRSYPLLTFASSTQITKDNDGILMVTLQDTDSSFLTSLREFEKNVTSAIFPVYVVSVDGEGDISFIDKRGVSKVLITKGADTKKVWSTLVSAIDTDPLKTKLIESKSNLEYLDIRYGNKVFYKFSNTSFQNSKDTGILEGYEHATSTSR